LQCCAEFCAFPDDGSEDGLACLRSWFSSMQTINLTTSNVKSIFFHLDGSADGAQDGFVLLQLQIVDLPHGQDSAAAAVKTANPAGIRQVKAEEADVVSHRRQARH